MNRVLKYAVVQLTTAIALDTVLWLTIGGKGLVAVWLWERVLNGELDQKALFGALVFYTFVVILGHCVWAVFFSKTGAEIDAEVRAHLAEEIQSVGKE